MEAVRHGVVWIGDKLYSQIPMYVPDAAEWTQPADGRRPPPHDSHPSVERGYGRPPPWDERDVKREDISPYGGPSRSHSAPVPRASLPPYPSEHYRHSGPPGYAYPPPMEHGPPHYPVHMGGPPMGPYMGPDYSSPYFTLPIRPQSQQMRSRQQISCHPCRNRKVKCSGTTPCEACVKIKREDECVYEKTVRRRGKGKKAGTGSEENGEHKLESTDERQSDDERRDASTSPVRERKDVELRDERERQDGDRESRDGTRKRPRSRPTSPHRRTAPAPRRMRESP
ncbi:hypothetical protein CC85DRAFT_291420 [Cutaneotrichosporon oleaginosum]|uniref:Zn(2)-C6 fungal-type domain-containing protein n=1 Tax=Cutaneotrichosporon oleaginosum TaxID=879819 RepID=A0A0J0XRE3_9TREE|nr:uncharacterized protein CC85DRAFT_291420 [Cutaneotrichosporon oleaginosum]KLT43637.1 hypothetical protein CC85DRAFT_291420 [Cutaneotrichosporon oleaginosum]TXT12696.1 hypothetical protein COLE_03106 [Cutaneotrichosporon oleaginosum]